MTERVPDWKLLSSKLEQRTCSDSTFDIAASLRTLYWRGSNNAVKGSVNGIDRFS
jgi:hypothetical protein